MIAIADNLLIAQRYALRRRLKEKQGVATYLAEDLAPTARERDVIIKLARFDTATSAAQARLEHEASLLSALFSPYITRILGVGKEAPFLWVAMPHVEGEPLSCRLSDGPLGVRDVIEVGRCLAQALVAVHSKGILHRDIKPSNIILTEGARMRAVLIDFGFALSSNLTGELADEPVGTVLYVSPEQAGLLDHGVDERSDLYSLGVVLHECLTGKAPFQGKNLNEVLRQHLSAPPPEIGPLKEPLPRALDDIVRRLLTKDPRERYQSAEVLFGDLDAIATAWDHGERDPILSIGAADKRHSLTEPSFIGREEELDAIAGALRDAERGRGSLLLLEAYSGTGKSRLLDQAARMATQKNVWVLRGQGLDQAAARPFQMLAGVFDEARTASRADASLAERLARDVGDQIPSLIASMPEAGWLGTESAQTVEAPEAYGEVRAMQAGAAFLDALGTEGRPALVLFDDCQWADDLMVRLLNQWSRQAPGRGRHVVVVVSFRTEEVASGHPLRRLLPSLHLTLRGLHSQQIKALAESMAGALPAAAVETVEQLADGNPFMASAVLRGLVESGALRRDDEGWRVETSALARAQSSRRAAAFLARRLRLLSSSTLEFLTAAAVLGKAFSVELAAELAAKSMAAALAAVAEARRRHIIWEDSSGATCRFLHDKLRETLLAELTEGERRSRHAKAAALIERYRPGEIFDLAFHFDAAGEPHRALPYALAAAESARSRHALAIAEQQFLIAERGATGGDAALRAKVAQGLGEVLMLAGRYADAEVKLDQAQGWATDVDQQIAIAAVIGELAFKRGDMRAACDSLERALSLLGESPSRHLLGQAARLTWEVLVQLAHTLVPKLCMRRDEIPPKHLAALRVYSRLAYAYWFRRGKLACSWAHLRNLNIAERYRPSAELAQAYSEHGPVLTMVPWFKRGRQYVEHSLHIRRDRHDDWGQGQSLHFLGVVEYASSRFHEAFKRCSEATSLLERTGDRWEVNTARWHMAYCQYRLGDLGAAVQAAKRLYQDAREIGDHSAAGIALSVWSKASGGKVPKDLLELELGRNSDDLHTRAELLQADGIRYISDGQFSDAARVLAEAQRLVDEAGFRQEYVAPIRAWLATALRFELEQTTHYAKKLRQKRLAKALKTANAAVAIARCYRNNLPHALREKALLHAIGGDLRTAWNLLVDSKAEAERQGARHERGLTTEAMATLAALDNPAAADALHAEAATIQAGCSGTPADLVTIVEEASLTLADRFATLLEVGPSIVSAVARDAVFDAVQRAASQLLHSNCLVIKVAHEAGGPVPSLAVGDPHAAFSIGLVKRAIATGAPAVVSEEGGETPGESILLRGIRSALCVPVYVRGRVAACLYVSSERVGRLFHDEEIKLAQFIAALGGAALENAEGFAQLQLLNDSLETQVAERRRVAEELLAARQAAEAANQAKSEFLASISHEIRTPLGSILGSVELLESGANDERERGQFHSIIKRNGDQLLSLVNDILDLSKIEAGRLILENVPVNISGEIDSVVSSLSARAEQKGLKLAIELGPQVPGYIMSDPLRLRQILLNLIGNAIKFTHRGTIRVEGARRTPAAFAGRRGICLSVVDTGIGLNQSQTRHLFQPFSQADASTSRRFGGSGLGLALARKLAHALGGELILERSEVGVGSTFTLWLEERSDWIRARPQAVPVRAGANTDRSFRVLSGLKLLLVEDAPDSQLLLAEILRRRGATVEVADDGPSGMHAAKNDEFNLVLLDIGLPGMDGVEVLKELRGSGYTVPIIMLTAHGLNQERDRCVAAGCNDYVTKPVKAVDLLRAILTHCDHSSDAEHRVPPEKGGFHEPRRDIAAPPQG